MIIAPLDPGTNSEIAWHTLVFGQLVYWHWLTFGALLIGAEMLLPGTFLLWIGLGAIVTGIISALYPDLAWQWQLGIFSGLSVISIVAGRHVWRKFSRTESDEPLLNQRGARMHGRTTLLEEPIQNGRGRARFDDSSWSVRGPDTPAGGRIIVTGVEGSTLVVESAPE
ncbi:MAG: NfeD family protein [Rhodospirillales bacterium]